MPEPELFLLVEDSEDDAVLIRRNFLQSGILNPIQVVSSGEQAMEYLDGVGRYADRATYPLPGLVFLDLKLPGKDGFAVLAWLRRHPTLSRLRVVVLTSSAEMRNVNMGYFLGADSFLVKPVDFERFTQLSHALGGNWVWMSKK